MLTLARVTVYSTYENKTKRKLKLYESDKELSEVISLVGVVKNLMDTPMNHLTYHTSIQQYIYPFRCHLTLSDKRITELEETIEKLYSDLETKDLILDT